MAESRQYPSRPFVGVGVVVVRRREGIPQGECEVLVVQRGAEPGYGQLSIPGGAVELGETLSAAAKREVAEECGVEIDITGTVEAIDRIFYDTQGAVRFHYVLVDLAAWYVRGELRAASDILSAQWLPASNLDAAGLATDTLGVIRKGLDILCGAA